VLAEDDHRAAGHVLARVIACTLDHGDRARVANGETFAGATCAVELSTRGPVERRVAHQYRITRVSRGRRDRDSTAAHRLADAVVCLADERDLHAGGQEGAEALTCRALESRADPSRRRLRAEGAPDAAAQSRTDGAVAVRDRVREVDQPRRFEGRSGVRCQQLAELSALGLGGVLPREGGGPGPAAAEQRRRREQRFAPGRLPGTQQAGAADGVGERPQSERSQPLPHLLRHVQEVRLDHLRRRREFRA
jgi:hypothetical protein